MNLNMILKINDGNTVFNITVANIKWESRIDYLGNNTMFSNFQYIIDYNLVTDKNNALILKNYYNGQKFEMQSQDMHCKGCYITSTATKMNGEYEFDITCDYFENIKTPSIQEIRDEKIKKILE